MIIPKAFGIIPFLPRRIGGADVRLGYSIPTKHGGTQVPVWEFDGWPVHLLGGSPHAQMRLRNYLRVVSADGNMINRVAMSYGKFWFDGTWINVGTVADMPYEAFRRSCENTMAAWRKVLA